MKKYDYRKALTNDIEDYITTHNVFDADDIKEALNDTETFYDDLYNDLWCADEVTGNGRDFYFNTIEETDNALNGNLSLLREACECFDCKIDILSDPKICDTIIRCYLLGEVFSEIFEKMITNFKTNK